MFKSVKTLTLAALIAVVLIIPVRAAALVTVNDLVESTYKYNGKTVMYEGEVIGEVLERGSYSWINVSDGSNAIGIWLKTEQAAKISHFGDYKHVGDTVRIIGTFSGNCSEHGGDVDIHCSEINVVKEGYSVRENIDPLKLKIAIGLLLCMVGFIFIFYRKVYKPKLSK